MKPQEIVIISGKGGTGKTSLTAAFAAIAAPIVLADCDVDAADLHLVTAPRIEKKYDFTGGAVAVVDREKCTGCESCYVTCRFDSVLLEKDRQGAFARVDPLLCEGCGACAYFCPHEAITMVEGVEGEWYESQTRFGPMVHARLRPAGENSGRLVTLVRRRAVEIAEEQGLPYVLLDGAPGIGCPVIASVTGADRVLAVCEPTLPGMHDLERVIGLTAHFKIPLSVCINRSDINTQIAARIEALCRERGVDVVGSIPYAPEFVTAQMKGLSVPELGGQLAGEIENLWKRFLAIQPAAPARPETTGGTS